MASFEAHLHKRPKVAESDPYIFEQHGVTYGAGRPEAKAGASFWPRPPDTPGRVGWRSSFSHPPPPVQYGPPHQAPPLQAGSRARPHVGDNVLDEPSPLGLTLKKTQSLLDLIEQNLVSSNLVEGSSFPDSNPPPGAITEGPAARAASGTWPPATGGGSSSAQAPGALGPVAQGDGGDGSAVMDVASVPILGAGLRAGSYSAGHWPAAVPAPVCAPDHERDRMKASNFPASTIRIGTYERVSRFEGDLVAKCYYAKRKLVWEVLDDGLKSKIEIQWGDISYLSASCPDNLPGTLEIEVSRPPMFFKEANPQPRKHTVWSACEDFTDGQATLCRKHVLQFPEGVLNRHFEKLLQCDPRLKSLVEGPLEIPHSLHASKAAYNSGPAAVKPAFAPAPEHPYWQQGTSFSQSHLRSAECDYRAAELQLPQLYRDRPLHQQGPAKRRIDDLHAPPATEFHDTGIHQLETDMREMDVQLFQRVPGAHLRNSPNSRSVSDEEDFDNLLARDCGFVQGGSALYGAGGVLPMASRPMRELSMFPFQAAGCEGPTGAFAAGCHRLPMYHTPAERADQGPARAFPSNATYTSPGARDHAGARPFHPSADLLPYYGSSHRSYSRGCAPPIQLAEALAVADAVQQGSSTRGEGPYGRIASGPWPAGVMQPLATAQGAAVHSSAVLTAHAHGHAAPTGPGSSRAHGAGAGVGSGRLDGADLFSRPHAGFPDPYQPAGGPHAFGKGLQAASQFLLPSAASHPRARGRPRIGAYLPGHAGYGAGYASPAPGGAPSHRATSKSNASRHHHSRKLRRWTPPREGACSAARVDVVWDGDHLTRAHRSPPRCSQEPAGCAQPPASAAELVDDLRQVTSGGRLGQQQAVSAGPARDSWAAGMEVQEAQGAPVLSGGHEASLAPETSEVQVPCSAACSGVTSGAEAGATPSPDAVPVPSLALGGGPTSSATAASPAADSSSAGSVLPVLPAYAFHLMSSNQDGSCTVSEGVHLADEQEGRSLPRGAGDQQPLAGSAVDTGSPLSSLEWVFSASDLLVELPRVGSLPQFI